MIIILNEILYIAAFVLGVLFAISICKQSVITEEREQEALRKYFENMKEKEKNND